MLRTDRLGKWGSNLSLEDHRKLRDASGVRVRAQTFPHGLSTRGSLEILGERCTVQAGVRPQRKEERMEGEGGEQDMVSRSSALGEGESGGSGSRVRCWNRHPAPSFRVVSSPSLLLTTSSTNK